MIEKAIENLSHKRLEQIASDFSFTEVKKEDALTPVRDTLFVYCVDPKLADQAAKLKKSGGYGFDEAGAFVYPIAENDTCKYSESLRLNFMTEYKLILGSGNHLQKVIVMGHSFCGAVNSLDIALFIKSRKNNRADILLDDDQLRHLSILGEHEQEFISCYKDFDDVDDGREDRQRMLERLICLISAENTKKYLSDRKLGMAAGIRSDENIKRSLLAERPRIYPCIAYCEGANVLAHDDIEVFIPEVKDFVKISLIRKALGLNAETSENYFKLDNIDEGLQSLYRRIEEDVAGKLG